MEWIIFLIFVLLILASTASTRLVQPLLEIGPVKMEWRDIIALAIVGIAIYGLYAGQLSVKEVLATLAGLLVGKLLFR